MQKRKNTSRSLPSAPSFGILTGKEIESLQLVIIPVSKPHVVSLPKLGPVSCELRFGYDYFLFGDTSDNGKMATKKLNEGEFCTIKPFDFILFSTFEHIDLSQHHDIVGRFGLKIRLALKGLVMQVGPQVEPGYKGPLFGALLNTSGSEIRFAPMDSFLEIEFHRMSSNATIDVQKAYPTLIDFIQKQCNGDYNNLMVPNILSNLKNTIKECQERHGVKVAENDQHLQRRSNKAQISSKNWGVLACIIATIALVIPNWKSINKFIELTINRFNNKSQIENQVNQNNSFQQSLQLKQTDSLNFQSNHADTLKGK